MKVEGLATPTYHTRVPPPPPPVVVKVPGLEFTKFATFKLPTVKQTESEQRAVVSFLHLLILLNHPQTKIWNSTMSAYLLRH